MRTAAAVVLGALAAASLAGCGPRSADSTRSASATATSSVALAAEEDGTGVARALYPECEQRARILHYLATGDDGGDPSLDQQFAGRVGLPVPQARALADAWIQACDQQIAGLDSAAAASGAGLGAVPERPLP